MLAAVSDDGQEISLWNVGQRQRFETLALGDGPEAFTRTGCRHRRRCLRPGGDGGPGRDGSAIRIAAEAGTGRLGLRAQGRAGVAPWGWGNRLALAGHILVAVRPDDQTLRLFDVRTGSLLRDMHPGRAEDSGGHGEPRERAALDHRGGRGPGRGPGRVDATRSPTSPPGAERSRSISGTSTGSMRRSRRLELPKPEGRRPTFAMAAFSPDGKTVAIALSRGSSVSLFSAIDGEPGGSIETQAEQINSLALGANKMLAAATGSTIQLWDLRGSRRLSSPA